MENFLIYIAKSALAASAFYLLYLVLFQHQKQFVFNRIYLPVSLALSFIIPLITFTSVRYIHLPTAPVETNSFAYLAEPTVTQPVAPAFEMEWFHYLMGIYALGILGFLCYLILGHFKAFSIIKKSRLQKLFNVNVNVTNKDVHPFSFFNRIVLSDRTLDNPNLGMIVLHEDIHVREKHTFDILFAEILFLLQWFNPFVWLLKDAIKNNLEYKTDHQVVKTIDPQQYQLAMVGLAHKEGIAPFLTAMNGSQLKNRIVMMKKKTRNKYALLKQLLVLPLLAVLTMSLANKEVKTEIVEPAKQIKIVVDGQTIPQNDPRLESVDFSKGIDGREVVLALGIEDKVVANAMSFDKNPKEDGVYCIQTRDYEVGTDPEFDKMVNKPVVLVRNDNLTVKGTVVTGWGEAIPNAKILNNESSEEFVADEKGNFELSFNGIEKPVVLSFSAPGYYKNDIVFYGNKKELRIALVEYDSEKELTVIGKVSDHNGTPLPGTAIIVKGSTTGTLADMAGNYKIETDRLATLIFSMVGFQKKEIEIDGQKKIDVQLEPEKATGFDEETQAYFIVEEMPEFPGGNIGLRNYLEQNQKYPQIALLNGIQGTVYVSFVINEEGNVVQPKIARSVDPALDKEALRLVSSLPRWKPGKQNGKLVKVNYTVKVDFKPTPEQLSEYRKASWTGKLVTKYAFSVSGKVVDKNGEPVKGAAVVIKGKNIGTITDNEGNYKLGINDEDATLIVMMSGFARKEAEINGQEEVDVQLEAYSEPATSLEIKSVKSSRKGNLPSIIVNSKGVVDNGEPLYVVDGVEVTNIDYLKPETIESISVLKDAETTSIYGDKGKNGVVLVTTKAAAKKGAVQPFEKNSVRISDNKEPLYVIDGKPVAHINELDPGDIESMTVLKGAEATALYGTVGGKNGVIQVRTKPGTQYKSSPNVSIREGKGLGNKKPLFILDGEKYDGDINNISPGDIFSISVLKDEITKEIYGNEANDGVVIIYTNSYKISSIQDLRKFIAQKIRYPLVAQERNQTGEVKVNVRVESDGRVTVLSDEDTKDDAIALDEVVVVAYAPKSPKLGETDITNEVLKKEVKRVAYMMPAIDISELMGKDVIVRVKFDLQ